MQTSGRRMMNGQESCSRRRPAGIMGVFLCAVTAMPLLISPRLSAGQLTPAAVTMDAGTLSVSLREARLHDVMEAIARLSGIEFILAGQSGQTTVTDSFRKLSLEDGL